jgi:hypothetical protein
MYFLEVWAIILPGEGEADYGCFILKCCDVRTGVWRLTFNMVFKNTEQLSGSTTRSFLGSRKTIRSSRKDIGPRVRIL